MAGHSATGVAAWARRSESERDTRRSNRRPAYQFASSSAAEPVENRRLVAEFAQRKPSDSEYCRNVGRIDEWHLNHDKPLRHFAFDLGAGFSQVREVPVMSFLSPRLVAIGAIGDAVGGDGVEQDLVQA